MMPTPVIDTHLHFWDLATYHRTEWLEGKPALQRSFLPQDVAVEFAAHGVDGGVIVEAARDSHALNRWWLDLAAAYPQIVAVVAGCALEQEDLAGWLDEYGASPAFVGVRTAPVGPPDTWDDNRAAQRGLAELARRDLALDLLVPFEAFTAVGRLAARYPTLRMNLNHCANPPLRDGRLDAWAAALAPLAAYPNVHIKYSSLLLYSYPDSTEARLRQVTDFLFERFGVARLFWGSNWPVELLGGSYGEALAMMRRCAEPLSDSERAALFGGNALRFYDIPVWPDSTQE
jgi:L-fuconolactonase